VDVSRDGRRDDLRRTWRRRRVRREQPGEVHLVHRVGCGAASVLALAQSSTDHQSFAPALTCPAPLGARSFDPLDGSAFAGAAPSEDAVACLRACGGFDLDGCAPVASALAVGSDFSAARREAEVSRLTNLLIAFGVRESSVAGSFVTSVRTGFSAASNARIASRGRGRVKRSWIVPPSTRVNLVGGELTRFRHDPGDWRAPVSSHGD
jgi:hypothetical protein